MLAVERKKTDKVDLGKPLQQYVRNQYSAQAAQDLEEAFNTVQQLREDVRNIQDKNEATRDLVARYYAILSSLEMRFPIRISFTWYESFKSKKTSQYSIYYEKANVLFNLGAINAQIGNLQNRSSVEGLKVACQNFQAAAGVFQELKEELERHPQPGVVDLSPECVNMLINLMLAQAQECFYEKAVKDNMNPALMSKLSAQSAEFYEVTQQMMGVPAVSGIIAKTWIPHVAVKIAMFKANAHYRLSISLGQSDEYGQQLARLKAAMALLEDAKKKHIKSVPSDLQQMFNNVHTQIASAFAQAERENDTIYHDMVPAETSLAPLEKKVIVKALPLPENAKLAGQKDPFYSLIPFAVTQKLSAYQERKDGLARNELRGIDEQNQLAIGILSSMNLPGAIEALETSSGSLPQALQEKMGSVKSEGGARLILEFVETLNKLADEDFSLLAKAVQKLDDEEKDDDLMRQKYPTWQRTPSHTLTANLRQEAAKYKGNIEHARKSDSYVLKKFQDHQQFIVRLSGSPQDILAILPSNQDSVGSSSPVVQGLKQSLTALDRVIAQRAQLRSQLTNLSQSDDITSRLLSTTQNDEEVFSSELSKYTELQSKIQETYSQQADLLNRIQQDNTKFVSGRQTGNPNAQREQIFQQLTTAFKVYSELKGNLREGIQFYTNFQEILKQFARKCEDFAFARETEKQDILGELQKQSGYQQQPSGYQQQTSGYQQQPSGYQQQTSGYQQGSVVSPPTTANTQPKPQVPGQWQPNMQPVYQQPSAPLAPQGTYQVQGYQQPPQGYQPYQQTPQGYVQQGFQPAPQGYQPAPQGYQPAPQGYQPAPQGYQPPPQGFYGYQQPPGSQPPQGYNPQQKKY